MTDNQFKAFLRQLIKRLLQASNAMNAEATVAALKDIIEDLQKDLES